MGHVQFPDVAVPAAAEALQRRPGRGDVAQVVTPGNQHGPPHGDEVPQAENVLQGVCWRVQVGGEVGKKSVRT